MRRPLGRRGLGGAEAVSRNKRQRQPPGELLRAGIFFLLAVFEAEAVSVHLQNVDVMGQSIQERSGETFRSEDVSPLDKGRLLVTNVEVRS